MLFDLPLSLFYEHSKTKFICVKVWLHINWQKKSYCLSINAHSPKKALTILFSTWRRICKKASLFMWGIYQDQVQPNQINKILTNKVPKPDQFDLPLRKARQISCLAYLLCNKFSTYRHTMIGLDGQFRR